MRVYVFGPGVGESIVLQYPKSSGKEYFWGVIDCHSERILNFLRDEHDVQELEFVCWTHPHADHHDGMPALLQSYENRINRFWRFGGYNANMILAFSNWWTQNAPNLQKSELSKIETIFNFVSTQKKRNPNSYKVLTDVHHSLIVIDYNGECRFRISSLSPSSKLAEEYTSTLGKCLEKPDSPDWEAFDGAHNSISAVLLVEFGKTRILFGADADKKVWGDIADSEERQNIGLSICSHFVKVSHHGSEGAYHKDIWLEIAQDVEPSGVVTPFTRSQLPNNKGISLLKKHCKEIYLTATRKNYHYYNTLSTLTKLNYKWHKYTTNADHCTFEFDKKGNLTETSLSDTAVVF
jgi:beta-lactamase superfamily II metal-dependent hydrolase